MCDPTEGSWHHQTVQTEADGVFLFRGVVPGEVVLTATAQGNLAVKKELGLLREGDVRGGVTIELDQGRSISGIVRWGDGTPAGDAWVTIEQDKDARTIAMMIGKKDSQRTAADGSFTISGLEDTICVVRASSRAVLSADKKRSEEARAKGRRGLLRRRGSTHRIKLEDIQPGTTGLILVLEPGDRVTGKAVDDLGEPISRFLISAEPQTGGPSTLDKDDGFQRIVITLDGSFAVDGLRDGAWVLSAHADDHASSEKVVITSPGAGEVEFVLPRHGRVHGIVRGPGGDPVSGANVQMEAAAEGEPQTIEIMYGNWGGKATTDGEGRFEAKDIAPGRKAVYATSEDFGQGLPSYITVEPGATLEGVALRLRSPAGILGQVHGAVGQVARREITIRGQDGVNHRETVTSDSSGRFEVEGLSPGKYRLQLQAPEEPESRVAGSGLVQAYVSSSREDLYQNAIQFVVLEEGDRERVVLGAPLSNPVQVSGRVTSAGEPVPGHQVHCTSEVDRSRNRATVVTDSEGQYSLTVAGQGSYIFRIGSGRNTTESTHELSQATCRIDFELPAGSFSGSLLGAGGEAIEKGNLKLVRYQDTAGEAVPQKARAVSSASDGSFEFEYIEPGRYFLRASDSPRWAWNQDHGEDLGAVLIDDLVFAEGESRSGFEVQLEIGGLVTGTVLGADGQGLSGAKLKLTTSSGHELSSRRTSRSDWSGGFSISGVGPGTYFLQAQKNGVKSQAQKVHISSSSEVSVQLVLDTE
jgi:protocatechuate 3,4-dioxygenase beta subunit